MRASLSTGKLGRSRQSRLSEAERHRCFHHFARVGTQSASLLGRREMMSPRTPSGLTPFPCRRLPARPPYGGASWRLQELCPLAPKGFVLSTSIVAKGGEILSISSDCWSSASGASDLFLFLARAAAASSGFHGRQRAALVELGLLNAKRLAQHPCRNRSYRSIAPLGLLR